MATKEDWKDIGNILGDDKDSYHIYICCRTRDGCNALPAKTAFLYPTAIAKSIC